MFHAQMGDATSQAFQLFYYANQTFFPCSFFRLSSCLLILSALNTRRL